MISLALRLLPVWRWLRDLFMRRPLLTACFFLALWGAWERSGRMKALDQRDQCRTASQAAAEATKALRAAEQAKAKETASHVQIEHIKARPASDDAADRYIRAHRVRADDISAALPVDQAASPAVPAPVPAQAVVVSEQDLRICGELYDYALDAHNWAVSVGER